MTEWGNKLNLIQQMALTAIILTSGKSNMNTNTLIPTKTSSDLVKERLADLKENLLNEQRSKKPSPLYIKDLEASIKQCERMLGIK